MSTITLLDTGKTPQRSELKGWDGKAQLFAGDVGANQNRYMAAAAAVYATATNTASWSGDGVTEISILPISFPCRVVFGALDAGSAAAALADTGTVSTDILWDYILAGERYSKTLTSAISRVDFLPIGGSTVIHITAV